MEIISRAEAKALGLNPYFTGIPCKHGHIVDRATINGACRECDRLKQYKRLKADPERAKEALRKYRARPDYHKKIREYTHRVNPERGARMAILYKDREDRASALAAGQAKYASSFACPQGHIGERFSKGGKCVECNRIACHLKESARKGCPNEKKRKRESYERNREAKIAQAREWGIRNPDKLRACKKANQANRRTVEKSGDRPYAVLAWEKSVAKVCYWCNCKCKTKYHVDHYTPLSKGGKHEVSNLVIACPTCNLRKSAKDPLEFAASVGRLF